MNEKAKRLYDLLAYAVQLKQYQRDFTKKCRFCGLSREQHGAQKHEYQQATYCNLFARGVLNYHAALYWITEYSKQYFKYDITFMNPNQFLSIIERRTPVDVAYDNVDRMAKSGIAAGLTHDKVIANPQAQKYPLEVSEIEAYDFANQGIPIWVVSKKLIGGIGHEAIVCPSDEPYEEGRGNRIAQAGWLNGFFYMNQIFTEIWRSPNSDIKYFKFPEEAQIGNI